MERLDLYLSKDPFFSSRTLAQDYIKEGLVKVNGKIINKASYKIEDNDIVTWDKREIDFVSRGGNKLYGAILDFNINLNGKVVLDVGASTGGFSDVCLQNGASYVYAVDSGSNQLAEKLLKDPRVKSMENINARYLTKDMFDKKVDFVCMDVSFISIDLICDSLFSVLENPVECVFLIKPQFEVGKAFIGKNGIVKDKKAHKMVLDKYISYFTSKNMKIKHLSKSHTVGRDGNQEYLIHLSSEGNSTYIDTAKIIKERG